MTAMLNFKTFGWYGTVPESTVRYRPFSNILLTYRTVATNNRLSVRLSVIPVPLVR